MNLSTYLNSSVKLWENSRHEAISTIDITTVRHDVGHHDGLPSFQHDIIPASECSYWLSAKQKDLGKSTDSLVTYVIWILRDIKEQTTYVCERTLKSVLAELRLDHPLDTCFTAYAGVQEVTWGGLTSTSNIRQYCFRVHPKVVLVWSHDPIHHVVYGICLAGKQQLARLRDLTEIRWERPTMMLPLACATMLSIEVDGAQDTIKDSVRKVEVRTGYHNWQSRREDPAAGDLGLLSADMSGAALKIAAVERKTKIIEQCLDFVSSHGIAHSGQQKVMPGDQDVDLLGMRTKMQEVDTAFIKRRIDIQLSALSNLIAQNDVVTSHTIANQSKIVAVASQHDSTSMKTLTVVTIFYLPGQVIASILAMPLFNWTAGQSAQSADVIVNSRFGIYWAVTIPLTIFTFLIAGLCVALERYQQRCRLTTTGHSRLPAFKTSEIDTLTRRRNVVTAS